MGSHRPNGWKAEALASRAEGLRPSSRDDPAPLVGRVRLLFLRAVVGLIILVVIYGVVSLLSLANTS
jgi:hypothetical protein